MAIPAQSRRLDHARPAAESPPPGALETFATAARAPDDDEMAQARREEALRNANDGVIGELAKRGISDPGFRRNVIWRDVPVYDEDAIWKGVQQARQQDQHAFPELPATLDAYRQQVAAPFDQEMAARHARLDRGGGVAKFAGGLNSGLSDPAQLPFMMIGAGEARSVAGAILQGAKTNAQIAAYQQPLVALQHAKYGEQLSTSEAAQNIGAAALLGGVLSGAGQAVSNARGVHPVPDAQLPDHVEATVGRANMTADERAAADVLRREQEIDAASPYTASGAGDAAHRAQLDDAVRSVLANTSQPSARARLMSSAAPMLNETAAREVVKSRIHIAETAPGNDYNPASGALGPYQFLKSTWGNLMRRLKPEYAGKSDAALAGLRRDPALNELAINASMVEYGQALRGVGQPETPGNLYLMHFLGTHEGPKVLDAHPDTPIAELVRPEVIEKNPFLRGKTAGDVVAWARKRMGDHGEASPADIAPGDELAAIRARRADEAAARAGDAAPTTGDLIAEGGRGEQPVPEATAAAPEQPGRFALADPGASPAIDVAPAAADSAPSSGTALEFQTEKGSVYRVEPDGTTTRNKAYRPEHGEASQGQQPTSQATWYVSPEDALKLAEFQKLGVPAAIERLPDHGAGLPDGRIGVRYLDGERAGKFEKRTVVTPQAQPAKGLLPVETWNDGRRVHFGNAITEVRERAPTGHPALDGPPHGTPGAARLTAHPEDVVPDGDVSAEHAAARFGEEPAPRPVQEDMFKLFDDPHGKPTEIVTESLEHDLRAALPKGEEGGKPDMSEGDRLGFRVDEEGPTIDRAQLVKEIDAENAAIEAVKKCL